MLNFSKKGLRIISVSLFFCFFTTFDSKAQADLVAEAKKLNLAQDNFWLKILKYEKKWGGLAKPQSAINNEEYFLSKEGRTNSEAELSASIEGFQANIDERTIDKHPICRFPARYKWIKKKLNWAGREDVFKKCSNYNKWSRQGEIKSISLFFATGYFGNPASYFGHALVRFNTDKPHEALLDNAVNYGALTGHDENPVAYILKGLFGGFNAAFTNQIFHQHSHNYSETELRDLWEYRLNLSSEEVMFVVDHTWELLSHKFSYLFLSDNCAYRIAELLEMVYETPLIPRNPLYSMPVTLFEGLGNESRSDGRALVTEVKRVPSRQSKMNDKYLKLSEVERRLVKNIISNSQTLKNNDFAQLNSIEKSNILEALMDYYSYQIISRPEDQEIKKLRHEIIMERFKLPTKTEPENNLTDGPSPHQAQNSFMLRTGYVDNIALGPITELTLRPALYDLLSPAIARPENTGLEIAALKVRMKNSVLEINELNFFKVYNFNIPKTDLPGVKQLSWKINLGLIPQRQNCFDCSVLGFQGGVGTAFQLFPHISTYMLIGGTAQTERDQYGTFAANPELGVLAELFPKWKIHFNLGYKKFINGQKPESSIFQVENRFGNSKSWDLRLSYKKIETTEVSLSAAAYF
ncbi:MAG: DUF4105 domain-containing protein [Bdellovibrionota bacterium]